MKDIHLSGIYGDPEGTPAFLWSVELGEGADLDGKFDVQFAAVKRSGGDDVAFAVIVDGYSPFVQENGEGTRALVDDLIDSREFIACINYANTEWQEFDGSYGQVVLGRDLGQDYDVTQRHSLDPKDVSALNEIARILKLDAESK